MDTNELRSLQEAYLEVVNGQQLDEAVKGQDSEMRRAAAAERRSGDKKVSPSKVKDYVKQQKRDISYMDKLTKKNKYMVGMTHEEVEVDEGMTMKDFKQQRSRQKQKDKRTAEKTSPTRRAGIHADKASPERAARHRANVDPDFEGDDERNYPGGKLRAKKVRKAKALGELGEQNDIYDIVLSHLLDEGYADTVESAEGIMINMSEEWRDSIVEDSRRMSNKQHTQRVRSNIKAFGSDYTPPSNYDPDANRGQGEVLTRKQIEKKRRKALRQ